MHISKLKLPPMIAKKQFGAKLSSSSSCGHIRPQLLSCTKSIAYDVNHNKFSTVFERFAEIPDFNISNGVFWRPLGPLEAKLDPVNHGVGGANRHKACPGRLLPAHVSKTLYRSQKLEPS